jgi:hypothetical protein
LEFLSGLLFLSLLVALVVFVLYRAHTYDARDAATLGLWEGWATRRGYRFAKGGRRRNALCNMHGLIEGMPFDLEVRRSPSDATLDVRVRAAATERRTLAFAVLAPKDDASRVPAGYVVRPQDDAALENAFDVAAPEGMDAALATALDARFRSALLRFPLPLVGARLAVRYENDGAEVSWPTDEPHDAQVDAALAILLVACPVTKAAKKKMNGTPRH